MRSRRNPQASTSAFVDLEERFSQLRQWRGLVPLAHLGAIITAKAERPLQHDVPGPYIGQEPEAERDGRGR